MTSPTPPSPNVFGGGPTNNPPPPPLPPVTAPNNTQAIIALVLGILSMPCFCGFLTGVPAIIIGHMELKAIREGRSAPSNQGLAKAGFITGIIGTALTCLIAIGYLIFIMVAVNQQGGFKSPSTF